MVLRTTVSILFALICVTVATELNDVVKRIGDLEHREKSHVQSIEDLKQQLGQQVVRLRELEKESAQKDDVIAELNTRVDALVEILDIARDGGHDVPVEIVDYKDAPDSDVDLDHSAHNHTIPSLDAPEVNNQPRDRIWRSVSTVQQRSTIIDSSSRKRLLLDSSPSNAVAFHSVNEEREVAHIGQNQNIVFGTELLNVGGGYHSQHGIFIAPVPGIYVFSASIMSYVEPHAKFDVGLVKNDVILAKVYGHGDTSFHDQGSVTVTVQLATDDEVWLMMINADNSLWGGRYTSFTGFLLAAL